MKKEAKKKKKPYEKLYLRTITVEDYIQEILSEEDLNQLKISAK
jgi:hypothetical protein